MNTKQLRFRYLRHALDKSLYPLLRVSLLPWLFLLLPLCGAAQDDFKIVGHRLNKELRRIEMQVRAVQDGAGVPLNKKELLFTETFDGLGKIILSVDSVAHVVVENKAGAQKREDLNVFFLVAGGVGGSPEIATQRRHFAQKAVQILVSSGNTCRFFITDYNNAAPRPSAPLNSDQVDTELQSLETHTDTFANLYQGIIQTLRFAREQKGEAIIFILTDGQNRETPETGSYQAPYTFSDVLFFLGRSRLNTAVFPVAIGTAPDSLLWQMARQTPHKMDTCFFNALPPDLAKRVGRKVDILYNNVVYLYTKKTIFSGEKRSYKAKWINGPRGHTEANYDITDEGSPSNPIPLGNEDTGWGLFFKWILGAALVAGFWAACKWLVPFVEKHDFFKRYVRRYQREPNITRTDPLTGEPIQEGEWVVYKCTRKICTLATWEHVGNKCPNHPRCLDFSPPCDGKGAPSNTDDFFKGKGIFRYLNWVWFGMLGGLVGWTFFAFFQWLGLEAFNELVHTLYEGLDGSGRISENAVASLAQDTLLGATFGAGICFALSWVEERGQPRQLSWGRIVFRTLIGFLVSSLVFFAGFYINYAGHISDDIWAALFTWMAFGLCLGAVLSMDSSVTLLRGIGGGLLAALLAFCIFLFFHEDFTLGKLFASLLMGATLGITLVSVITRLEDFELEYISPETFRQSKPISKWLKQDLDVFIGRESGNYVYVKWEDPAVEPYHAQLRYIKGTVFIEPLAETLVNGKIIPPKTQHPLRDGDLIQLGRESITRMRYREKRAS